jgi:hypothetical protein
MPTTESLTINGREFIARALTVKQIIELTESSEKKEFDLINHLFEDGLDARAFYLSLKIKQKDIDGLYPEDVKKLMEAVARVNPAYAGMEKRLRMRLAELRKTLSAPAAA